MTVIPSMALALAAVYLFSHTIGEYFSDNVAAVLDLLLFVVVMTATNSLLKNLRGD